MRRGEGLQRPVGVGCDWDRRSVSQPSNLKACLESKKCVVERDAAVETKMGDEDPSGF